MALIAAYAVPHQPNILLGPQAGHAATDGLDAVARAITALKPDTLIMVSPYAARSSECIALSPGAVARGSLSHFGVPGVLEVEYDAALVRAIASFCEHEHIPADVDDDQPPTLDHGVLVPLSVILKRSKAFKVVRIGISSLSRETHYRFGQALARTINALNRRAVMIVSGDMAMPGGQSNPRGRGQSLASTIASILRTGDFGTLLALDEGLICREAGSGFSGLVMLAGAFDRRAVNARLYALSGPLFGGCMVAAFEDIGPNASRDFLDQARARQAREIERARAEEDPYVRLARLALEHYVRTRQSMTPPVGLPATLTSQRSGAFVFISKNGTLRGRAGSIEPKRDNLAEEIMDCAVTAGTRSPYHRRINVSELDALTYRVSVLSPAERVSCQSQLDALRYGVIVSLGGRRALLFPDTEGVRTPDDQLATACHMAGIDKSEPFEVARFELLSHT